MAEEKKPKEFTVEDEEIPEDLRCGYFGWRPEWMQKYNHPKFLLACACFSTFVQGFVVNGLTPTNISSIERRFNFRSGLSAAIPSSYDLSAGTCAVIFGYLAMFLHNGKMLGFCTLVMSFGSFTMFLPHLFVGPYELGPKPPELCDISDNQTDFCDTFEDSGSSFLWLFMIGQMLHGVGGAAIYTVAVPYMDANIKTKNTALYIGIMLCFSALGPALGFICGGLFLSLYVDIGRVDLDSITITARDPRWVGAWWIGYLISGSLSLFVSVLYFGFPRKLSTADKYAAERTSEAYKGSGEDKMEDETFGRSPKDVLYSLKVIFTNPTWIFLTISGIVESSAVVAFTVFLPKVFQFQYSQTAVMAAIWGGLVVIPGAAGGQLLGGLVPKWLNLKLKGLLNQCLICIALGLILVFQFLLRCDMAKIAGLSVPYFNRSIDLDISNQELVHPCNVDCNCTTTSYDPICGADGIEYFSPCHGGCLDAYIYGGGEVYSNCSCIADSEPGWELPENLDARSGICGESCAIFPAFLVCFFFINIVTFMTAVAGSAATIRCVPDKERSFAYGVQATIVRFLGNVPGPIILGQVFDDSCWIWQDTCGTPGACWIYSSDDLGIGITTLGAIIKTVSVIAMFLARVLYKPPPHQILDETEIKEPPEKDSISQNNLAFQDKDSTHTEDKNHQLNNDIGTDLCIHL